MQPTTIIEYGILDSTRTHLEIIVEVSTNGQIVDNKVLQLQIGDISNISVSTFMAEWASNYCTSRNLGMYAFKRKHMVL